MLFDASARDDSGLSQHLTAMTSELDMQAAPIPRNNHPLDQTGLFDSIDESGEAALAQKQHVGKLMHTKPALGRDIGLKQDIEPGE